MISLLVYDGESRESPPCLRNNLSTIIRNMNSYYKHSNEVAYWFPVHNNTHICLPYCVDDLGVMEDDIRFGEMTETSADLQM